MTSLEFSPLNNKFQPKVPCEWGTGKSRKEAPGPPDDNAPPSWHYTNQPNEEPIYQVSLLQLSNSRPNDELIPRPEHFDASRLQVLRPFPSEHPYSSHISRFAVFPTSTNGNTQRKRHHKVVVLQKAKGFDARIEKIIGTDNDFVWPETDSDHFPNSFGPKTTFYPIPPKLFLPNDDQPRPRNNDLYYDEDERNEERRRATEDAAAETERKRWMTTSRCNSLSIIEHWKAQNLQHSENNMTRIEKIGGRIYGVDDPFYGKVSADSSHPNRKMAVVGGRGEDQMLNGTKFSDLPSYVNPGCSSYLPHRYEVSKLKDRDRRHSQGMHQIGRLHFDHTERMVSCPGDSKSEIHKKFDQCFPSRTPDLRLNSCLGKKHNFYGGVNSQILRGSTFVAA